MNETTLVIRWDGELTGLQDHALSLSAWGDTLRHLVRTYKRVGTTVLTSADQADYGGRGGRLHKAASGLDLLLTDVRDGCVELHFRTSSSGQQDLVLERDALARLVADLRAEASGTPTSTEIRSLLDTIPDGVAVQEWRAFQNGVEIESAVFGEVQAQQSPDEAIAHLVRVVGRVSIVDFDRLTVAIRGGSREKFTATKEQVEKALDLRESEVQALGVRSANGGPARLLRLEAASVLPRVRGKSERLQSYLSAWPETLRILGE